jgi:hypothetical protein
MDQFPWGVIIILGSGLIFTLYCIYYILNLAHKEMNDEAFKSDTITHKSKH